MGTEDQLPPDFRSPADVEPAKLHSPNSITVSWLSGYRWDIYKLKWSANSGPDTVDVIDGGDGFWHSYTVQPAQSGAMYTFQVKGCAKSAFSTGWLGTDYCSPASDPFPVTAAQNTTSTRTFLRMSGVDHTQEISIRNLEVASTSISLRALLEGF